MSIVYVSNTKVDLDLIFFFFFLGGGGGGGGTWMSNN